MPRDEIAHGGPPRDGIPALTDPKFVGAAQAGFLKDEDRVLGLAYAGKAKAYPLAILNWHEIVNDRFGGVPVVVTYCPLCYSGMVFEAMIAGRRHHFGVSGLLYNSDVLLYDRQSESLWSQLMAQAVSGPMKARRLTSLPLVNTTWRDWRKRHPDTRVLSRDTGHSRDYDGDPYAPYGQSPELMFPVAFRSKGYHPKERVLGIELDGVARAYPVSELSRGPAEFRDRIGQREVTVRFDDDNVSGQILDAGGKPLPAIQAYWFAWYAFHPETTIYRPAESKGEKR